MAIAKTASRNVAFKKVAKTREAIMEDQDEFLTRNTGHTEVGLEANNARNGSYLDLEVNNQHA